MQENTNIKVFSCLVVAAVLSSAERLGDKIKAVVSQAPSLDGTENFKHNIKNRGVVGTVRVALMGITDTLRGLIGLSPAYIKVVGIRGKELAIMELSPDEVRHVPQSSHVIHAIRLFCTPPLSIAAWHSSCCSICAVPNEGTAGTHYRKCVLGACILA